MLLPPDKFAEVVAWISAIPYKEWPQARPPVGGDLQPAMISDPEWHGFGRATQALVDEAMIGRSGRLGGRMLSVVMPGRSIKRHHDPRSEEWCARGHIPLLSNNRATFITESEILCMKPGHLYWVNPLEMHSIVNGGDTPRVHLIFDVIRA